MRVEWNDFQRALLETVPAFGNKDNEVIQSHYVNGICNYGSAFDDLWSTLQKLVNQTRLSARTPLLSVLLEGQGSSGKTAVLAKLAAESDFPFIRMLSPDSMIGMGEAQRSAALLKVFTDSYKSPLSIIVLDDIERLIEYTPVGCRFSNSVLQTLLVLLKKVPPSPARLIVLATTSIAHLLEDLQLTQAFNVNLHASLLHGPQEVGNVLKQYGGAGSNFPHLEEIAKAVTKPIGIKQLLMVLEMARSSADDSDGNNNTSGLSAKSSSNTASYITIEQFLVCLHTVGF
jgi:vesicle-fusing ATPase